MQRFYKQPEINKVTTIVDFENTEPVCTVFSKWHPYAVDLILEALNKAFPEVKMLCGHSYKEEYAGKLTDCPDCERKR